jgi:hypothetical protein
LGFLAAGLVAVDALVWAFSELLVEPMKGDNIYELYRREAEALAARGG